MTPGTPAIAGRDAGEQSEKDWIDNRWSRTAIGQFLAASLRLPNGMVTKALTIRLGERDEASVCFDTANLNLRAGWTGGFLKPDPARFGLINSPAIDGGLQFVVPDGMGWIGATGRFTGFHVHGKRVVLEYKIGDSTVRESPWFVRTNDLSLFVRTFEVGPSQRTLKLRLHAPANRISINHVFDQPTFAENQDETVTIAIPPRSLTARGKVFLWLRGTESQQTAANTIQTLSSFDDLGTLSAVGTAQWLPMLETTGRIAPDTGPLAIDTLTVPYA
ncbi:MAG: hypothetical protein DME26_09060, partial [Verrucomicrobia bacterium]